MRNLELYSVARFVLSAFLIYGLPFVNALYLRNSQVLKEIPQDYRDYFQLKFDSTASNASNLPENDGAVGDDDNDLTVIFILIDAVAGFIIGIFLIAIFLAIYYSFDKKKPPLQLTNTVPGSFADLADEEEQLSMLTMNEQSLYRQAKSYQRFNPPQIPSDMSISQYTFIEERGLNAYDFIPDRSLPRNLISVNNRTEISFNFSKCPTSYPVTIQSNLAVPKTNDVYYYECKIYEMGGSHSLDSQESSSSSKEFSLLNNQLSIGLATKPYPFFRLPGRHDFSVLYDNDGSRRYSTSFPLPKAQQSIFPSYSKGDVIGVGYIPSSGTVFFARNGKKLSERKIGGHIKRLTCLLYPSIGALCDCKVDVNLGQYGFVLIEANIKKWGFCSVDGSLPAPPTYDMANDDVLVDESFYPFSDIEEEEQELARQHLQNTQYACGASCDTENGRETSGSEFTIPNSPPPFWATSNAAILLNGASASLVPDNITLRTLDGIMPPEYVSDEEEDEPTSSVDPNLLETDNQSNSSNQETSNDTEPIGNNEEINSTENNLEEQAEQDQELQEAQVEVTDPESLKN